MDSWVCPACGHKQVAPQRFGRNNVICASCDEIFPAPKERVTRKELARREEKEERPGRSGWRWRVAQVLFGEPEKALESGIAGAIGGILAGIASGVFNGIVAGNATMRATTGCVLGLSVGLVIGGLWGPYGILARIGLRFPPVIATALGGALAGVVISAIVGRGVLGSGAWLPIGAAAGATGAGLWALLCMHVEASEATRPRKEMDEDLSAYYDARLKRR